MDGKDVLRKIRQTNTVAERNEAAQACVSTLNLSIPALVDNERNEVNAAYAGWPDRLYVVDRNGRIAYKGGRGPAGFKPDEVEEWLKRSVESSGTRK